MRTRTQEGYPSPGDRPFLGGGWRGCVPEARRTAPLTLGPKTRSQPLPESSVRRKPWAGCSRRGHTETPRTSQTPHPLLRSNPHRVPSFMPPLSCSSRSQESCFSPCPPAASLLPFQPHLQSSLSLLLPEAEERDTQVSPGDSCWRRSKDAGQVLVPLGFFFSDFTLTWFLWIY